MRKDDGKNMQIDGTSTHTVLGSDKGPGTPPHWTPIPDERLPVCAGCGFQYDDAGVGERAVQKG